MGLAMSVHGRFSEDCEEMGLNLRSDSIEVEVFYIWILLVPLGFDIG